LVGRPTVYATKITDYISEKGLDKMVIILDKVPDEDLSCLYRNASLLVYISLFEGFGLPIVEAMASGCPVLTSNTSCLPEVGGNASAYCDPGNIEEIGRSIKKILEDKEYRIELIRRGEKRAMDFTPVKTTKDLFDVYKEVLENV
jgi:glycosyltransferase involved in cell wall biosynthesis